MSAKKTAKKTKRITGGQAGMRGYLVQTLVALLDGALANPPFITLTLEPDHDSEQFDFILEDAKGYHAVQIKSTSGQFRKKDVYEWAEQLEASGQAVEYRLCLVGLCPPSIARLTDVGQVVIDKKNLDLEALREQAAFRLDRFLRAEGLEPGLPQEREMLADALTAQLAAYSTAGKPLTYANFVKLLRTWIKKAPKKGPLTSVTRLRHGAERLVGRQKELRRLDRAWAGAKQKKVNIVTIVAWGGVGKTALVVDWMASMARSGWRGVERVFDWSFYSQGTRETTAASADQFIAKALEFFGDPEMAKSAVLPWDKGERLAHLISKRKTLLVLDGIEPLQHPPGPVGGKLKDPALEALLKGLALHNTGLCVVTTREPVTDLAPFRDTTTPEWSLEHLSDQAGAELLFDAGVNRAGNAKIRADDQELKDASREVGGHALTLRLLGNYLKLAHKGDIRKRDIVRLEDADPEFKTNPEDADELYGHAFKVMGVYEKWLESGGADGLRQLAILRLLGLFDRPLDIGCLAALRQEPAIVGLTEHLVGISDTQWTIAMNRTVESGLVSRMEEDSLSSLGKRPRIILPPRYELRRPVLDCHPLIRQYFAKTLREGNHTAWRLAHRRIYEHLTRSTDDKPQPSLEDLQPLYQAIFHGCHAGLSEEARADIYRDRILRGTSYTDGFYSSRMLGAYSSDLSALACFFVEPWRSVALEIRPQSRGWVLSEASFKLRALGRVAEALGPVQAAKRMFLEQGNHKQASVNAYNESAVQLLLGDIAGSLSSAEQSLDYAKHSGDGFMCMACHTQVGHVRHQIARPMCLAGAEAEFREAERIQSSHVPKHQLLYSIYGFQYCALILTPCERAAWRTYLHLKNGLCLTSARVSDRRHGEDVSALQVSCSEAKRRANRAIESEKLVLKAPLIEFAQNQLTLGRAALYEFLIAPNPEVDVIRRAAAEHIAASVDQFRRAADISHLPRGLASRAWLRHLEGDVDGCRADLDEAWQIAERGPMRLHMADVLLHRGRLFRDMVALAKARELIEQCGYHRRDGELADAEKAAKGW